MPRRRKGERARGPYPDRAGRRRIIQYLDAAGKIETATYASEDEAIRERDEFNAQAALPELLDEVERLRAENAQLGKVLDEHGIPF